MIRSFCLLIAATALAGCVGYTTYPATEGQWASSDINSPNAEQLMATALRRVIMTYPPPGAPDATERLAVSGPRGLTRLRYERLVRGVGLGSVALTPETESLPRYSVAGLRVRSGKAEVDVFRPVYRTLGEREWQMITVELDGGLGPWRIKRVDERVVGAFEPPTPYYLPPDETQLAAPSNEQPQPDGAPEPAQRVQVEEITDG